MLRSVPEKSRVVVEKVNMVKKAMRPTQANPRAVFPPSGAHPRVQRDARVPQLRRTRCPVAARRRLVRVCKKCGKDIPAVEA